MIQSHGTFVNKNQKHHFHHILLSAVDSNTVMLSLCFQQQTAIQLCYHCAISSRQQHSHSVIVLSAVDSTTVMLPFCYQQQIATQSCNWLSLVDSKTVMLLLCYQQQTATQSCRCAISSREQHSHAVIELSTLNSRQQYSTEKKTLCKSNVNYTQFV